jgi:poly(3-hydroxybutyrate) depolymerase
MKVMTLIAAVAVACGAGVLAKDTGSSKDLFEARTFRDTNGDWMPIRVFKPAPEDKAGKYPLIIWLHGAGGRGNTGGDYCTESQYLASEAVQKPHPCFVVAPRCPENIEQVTFPQRKGPVTVRLVDTQVPRGEKKYVAFAIRRNKKTPQSSVIFSNFRIYDKDAPTNAKAVDFSKVQFSPFGKQNGAGLTAEAIDGGKGMRLAVTVTNPNAAMKIPLTFTVSEKTVLEFDLDPVEPARSLSLLIKTDEELRDEKWVQVDWSSKTSSPTPAQPSYGMRMIPALIRNLQKEFNIDPQRVYIAGFSMGGFGTFDALLRYPELFAAGASVSGGGDESRAKELKNTPLWVFHGTSDPFVRFTRSKNMVEAIIAAGGSPKFSVYEGEGHMVAPKSLAEPGFLDWLFAQKKPAGTSTSQPVRQ